MKKTLIICTMLLCITGCKKETKNDINKFIDKDINLEVIKSVDDSLILDVKSTNEEIIDLLNIDLAFYNKDELVSVKEVYLRNLLKDQESFLNVELPKEKDEILEYTKIDIKTHKNIYEEKSTENYIDKIETSYKKNDDGIAITVKNNSGFNLNNIDLAIEFIKDNKIIALKNTSLVNVGLSKDINIYPPFKDLKEIEFDDIKININSAIKNK